jgi:hypothetical protein
LRVPDAARRDSSAVSAAIEQINVAAASAASLIPASFESCLAAVLRCSSGGDAVAALVRPCRERLESVPVRRFQSYCRCVSGISSYHKYRDPVR